MSGNSQEEKLRCRWSRPNLAVHGRAHECLQSDGKADIAFAKLIVRRNSQLSYQTREGSGLMSGCLNKLSRMNLQAVPPGHHLPNQYTVLPACSGTLFLGQRRHLDTKAPAGTGALHMRPVGRFFGHLRRG